MEAGLNLQEASYVFHFDRWWNPAVEAQAEDRAHRMGQQRPVFVYPYICADTIEEPWLGQTSRSESAAVQPPRRSEWFDPSLVHDNISMHTRLAGEAQAGVVDRPRTALADKVRPFVAAYGAEAADARDDLHGAVRTLTVLRAADRPEVTRAFGGVHHGFVLGRLQFDASWFDQDARHGSSVAARGPPTAPMNRLSDLLAPEDAVRRGVGSRS